MEAESEQPRNFLNGRRAAFFFFCSEGFIDCHENRDKDGSGSERKKYSTCLCNWSEAAGLDSNIQHEVVLTGY